MGRILAIDFGTRRTGIAVSDPSRIIAGGLDTVATHLLNEWLKKYIAVEPVSVIVVGKPVQMSGHPSETYPQAVKLAEKLSAQYPGIKVMMYDERFTSVMAHQAMLDGGMRKMQRRDKAVVDKISATIILQSFMESKAYHDIIHTL